MLLDNHAVVLEHFEVSVQLPSYLLDMPYVVLHLQALRLLQGFPSDAITFEAWLSSSDFCHAGQCTFVPFDTAIDFLQQKDHLHNLQNDPLTLYMQGL